jgi:Protein of unknown function (DUF3237)
MATIEVKPLFTIDMEIGQPADVIGATPMGMRSIGGAHGRFEGPGIKGTVTVTDYFLTRPDGIGEPEVRGIMRTEDGAFIYMRYSGLLDMRQVSGGAGGERPTGGSCQVRMTARFETGAERYRDLNNVLAIGIGEVNFNTGKIKYEIYAL